MHFNRVQWAREQRFPRSISSGVFCLHHTSLAWGRSRKGPVMKAWAPLGPDRFLYTSRRARVKGSAALTRSQTINCNQNSSGFVLLPRLGTKIGPRSSRSLNSVGSHLRVAAHTNTKLTLQQKAKQPELFWPIKSGNMDTLLNLYTLSWTIDNNLLLFTPNPKDHRSRVPCLKIQTLK